MPDFKTKADTSVEGIISKVFGCKGSRPFKMLVETEGGEIPIISWPNKATGDLPKIVAQLNVQADYLGGHGVRARVRKIPDKNDGYGIQYEIKDNNDSNTGYSCELIRDGSGYQNPVDVVQVEMEAVPVSKPSPRPQPTDRDTLIVDQVLFKGAVDLLKSDAEMGEDNAVDLVLAIWEGVRARHNPKPEPKQEAPADNDFEESFGEIQLTGG